MLIGAKEAGTPALAVDAPRSEPGDAPARRLAARRHRGADNHASGLAAEDATLRRYEARGARVIARRWRAPHARAEIDLVLREGEEIVFVEVKRAPDHDRAARALGPRQAARLLAAGSEWLAREPAGQDTPARFDLALVDAAGRVRVIENALVG